MTTDSATSLASGSPEPNPSAQAAPMSRALGWLAAGVLLLLWAYAVYRLGTAWYGNEDYAYGWFVPLLCLALFWERWKQRPAREPIEGSTGPLIVWGVLALTLLPTCLFLEVIPYSRFAAWPFAGAIVGITFCVLYLVGGRSWVHHFAFPVLFFLIAVPWPTRFEAPLIGTMSHLNAVLSTWAANLLGTPAIRHGVVIQTGAGMAGVDEACSGIRSFQAAVMVALFLGELFRYSFFRRLFFLLSGVALAFGCNVVRTTYLVRVCDLKGEAAVSTAHDAAGFMILGVTLAGLLILAFVFRGKAEKLKTEMLKAEMLKTEESAAELEVRTRWAGDGGQRTEDGGRRTEGGGGSDQSSVIRHQSSVPSGQSSVIRHPSSVPSGQGSGIKLAGALVGLVVWIVAIEAQMHAWFWSAEKQAVSVGHWSLQPPSQQAGFREPPIREGVRGLLKYDEGKQAEWRDVSGRPWQLYYLRWFPARNRYRAIEASRGARLHEPVVCLTGAGMAPQKNFGSQVREINGVTLLVNVQRFSDKGRPLHLLYCYWDSDPAALENRPASPPSTASALRTALRAVQVRDRARNEKCVIIIGVWGMATDEEAEAAFREFLERAIKSKS